MRNLLGFTTYLLLLLVIPQKIDAQPDSVYFEHLSVKQGLSHNIINAILQDREGFLWFGTRDGLNKYDGYNFTVYQPDPIDSVNNLRHNRVTDLYEDRAGVMWVVTLGGLHKVDKSTGKFTYYPAHPVQSHSRNICHSIYEDQQGMLLVASEGGVNEFNPTTGAYQLYPLPDNGDKDIKGIVEDKYGVLWIGTLKGLYQLDRQSSKYTPIILNADHSQQSDVITSIYKDPSGILWIASDGVGLYRLDAGSNRPILYLQSERLANSYIFPEGMWEDASGMLWIGTNDGLKRLNKNSGQLKSYHANHANSGSLSHEKVRVVYQDHSGTLWIGTVNGINKLANQTRKFHTYQIISDTSLSQLSENHISAIYEDQQGIIWLGTKSAGLYSFDRKTGKYTNYQASDADPQSLLSNQIDAVYEDGSGVLWIGTSKGLHALDRITGKFTRYPSEIFILTIAEDFTGKLWIGGNGLASFDRKTGKFTYYPNFTNDADGEEIKRIIKIQPSRRGELWLATTSQYLRKFNPMTGKFLHYRSGLNDNDIRSLYEDKEGILWIGTNQGGLNRFDPQTETFTAFTKHDGLPSNHIAGILNDKAGNLWLSTNKGLCRFNPTTKACRNYDQSDGLQNNEFNAAYAIGKNGDLLFGGTNGFNIFYPDSIQDNPQIPPVHITGFKVLNKPRLFSPGRIELSHHENFFSFDFVALNYQNPAKNQYAYQLVGVDQDWVYAGTHRFANYTSLNPGHYTFRVKGSNNDGVWNEKGVSIEVMIHPPWWQTWWAYSFYGLCFLAGVFAVDRFQRKRLIRKEQEKTRARELAQAREIEKAYHALGRKSTELEQQKEELQSTLEHLQATQAQLIQKEKMASLGELTAGIAHEIQNPLNFVNNFARMSEELCAELQEELDKGPREEVPAIIDDLKQNLERIHHHGQRADSIVKNMLQHSRASSGDKQFTDINALADEYLRLSYHRMRAKDKDFNAALVTDFDETFGKIEVVSQELGRVLLNLYNNAFYATEQKRRISQNGYQPEVKVSTKRRDNKIEISVRDNGTGMIEAVKQKVFQPFFTTKPTGEGTGLGLSLSYDIITKGHGGMLEVESREGTYTEFIIILPYVGTKSP